MKVNIYNEKWDINLVSQKFIDKQAGDLIDDGDSCYGLCDFAINTIYLTNEFNKIRTRSILIHEVTHAIRAVTQEFRSVSAHEEVCRFVATHIDEINKVVKEFMKGIK